MKRLFCPKGKTASVASLSRPCLIKNKNKKKIKIRSTQNTPRNPQPPGHRDQLETARDETRPTRQPMLARFLHRSQVCGNQPRLYTYIPTLLLLCRVCIRFGALFSRQRSFCFICCDTYLRFRGCPVMLDIELYVSACYEKTRRALYCRCCAAFVSVLVLYFLDSAASVFSAVTCISGFGVVR